MTPALPKTDRWLRLSVPAITILLVCLLVDVASRLEPSPMTPAVLALIVTQAYVIAELGRAMNRKAVRRFGERIGTPARVGLQLASGVTVAIAYALVVYLPIKAWLIASGERDAIGWSQLALIALAALAVAVVSGLTQFSLTFLTSWRDAEHDRLRLQVELLQAQLDPHFLFNSLNALYGTIAEDPARAQTMVLRLAALFRHALRHHDEALVPLAEELDFLRTYVDLLRVRHGDALQLSVEIDEIALRRSLPPLALQVLAENAVKHNRVDEGLELAITAIGAEVHVSNAIRRKPGANDGGVGLENLRRRYALLGAPPPRVEDDGATFRVTLALLESP